MRACIFIAALAASAFAQTPSAELANLREDVRLLNQRVGELSLRIEQLERENASLQRKADTGNPSYATVTQLNDAVAELNRDFKSALQSNKTETLQQVAAQMEKLANQTNAALDSLGRVQSPRPSAASSAGPVLFSDNFPKEGIKYTVVKGDTLAKIAQKTGGKREDIINANKLADPSRLQVDQVLFIPIAK